MPDRPPDRERILNALVFGGFALLSLPGLVPARPRPLAASLALLALAALGYVYAQKRKLPRAAGVLAFLLGWFVHALAALVLLWLAAVVTDGYREATARRLRHGRDERASPGSPRAGPNEPERALLLLAAARRADGRIRGFEVPFMSRLGEGQVPLLLVTPRGEEAVYVEAGAWNESRERRFLDWLEKLRSSDRRGILVRVHSRKRTPQRILDAIERTPQ